MRKSFHQKRNGKELVICPCGQKNAPIVYLPSFEDHSPVLLGECEKMQCPPFHLVVISHLNWEEELSPWPHEPINGPEDHFAGHADDFAVFLTETVLPFTDGILFRQPDKSVTDPIAEKSTRRSAADSLSGNPAAGSSVSHISSPVRILAGYSMAGLFALYAPYRTNAFSGIISASGSTWYPDFLSYVETHDYPANPRSIYLSLGNRESRTKNPYFSRTQKNTDSLCSIYRERGISSIFELNPGNHFRNPEHRLAKGIFWTLSML